MNQSIYVPMPNIRTGILKFISLGANLQMSRQMNCRLFSALKKVAFFSFIILMGACDFNGTKKSDKKDKSPDQDIVYETAVLAYLFQPHRWA